MGIGPKGNGHLFEEICMGRITPLEAITFIRSGVDTPQIIARPSNRIKPRDNPRPLRKAEERSEEKKETLDEVKAELHSLIGLKSVKELINEIEAYIKIQQRRREEKLASGPVVLHMIFKGSPGTGKTTVARLLGKLFCAMGVLEKGHLVEVERADLVGEYIGHTAQKTRRQVEKAMGGILFIDEAYSLCRGGEKDFGKEAIDTLVKAMEDHKDRIILILAGYRKEMDGFLRSNPGLRSRFPIHIDFPDYSVDELLQIGELMLRERDYKLTPEAKEKMAGIVRKAMDEPPDNLGNSRYMRNLIERAIRAQAVRLVNESGITREQLMLICPEDVREVGWGDDEDFDPWKK